MPSTYTGGCACGALRYEITGDPLVMLDCQCRQCQRDSGTGHQSHVTFGAVEVETTGEPSRWRMTGDGGSVKERAFCPTCGSAVWMTFAGRSDRFVVTAASLDDPASFRPQMVIWTAAGHAWDAIDPATTRFEKMPGAG
jgi:hypothetical protein